MALPLVGSLCPVITACLRTCKWLLSKRTFGAPVRAGVSPGWVPQLSDFVVALKALGYRALAHGAGGHAQLNTGAVATPAAAPGRSARKRAGSKGGAEPQAEGGPSGSGSGGQANDNPGGGAAAGGAGGAGARLPNLQALLRLLAGLCELHGRGVDVGFGNASEVGGWRAGRRNSSR